MAIVKLTALHLAAYLLPALLWPPEYAVWALFVAVLLCWASIEDWRTMEIPDTASALLLAGGLVWWGWFGGTPDMRRDAVLGAVLWPVLAWAVAAGYLRLRGWDGLGFGDVKLLAGIGLWTGFAGTVWVVLTASLSGIAVLLALAAMHRQPLSEIGTKAVAFGPFLCLSAWAVLLQGGRL